MTWTRTSQATITVYYGRTCSWSTSEPKNSGWFLQTAPHDVGHEGRPRPENIVNRQPAHQPPQQYQEPAHQPPQQYQEPAQPQVTWNVVYSSDSRRFFVMYPLGNVFCQLSTPRLWSWAQYLKIYLWALCFYTWKIRAAHAAPLRTLFEKHCTVYTLWQRFPKCVPRNPQGSMDKSKGFHELYFPVLSKTCWYVLYPFGHRLISLSFFSVLLIGDAQCRHNADVNQVFPDMRKCRPSIAPDWTLHQI